MGRINLTDRFIRSQKAAAPGRRNEYLDGILPGLALRVTDRGNKSFVLIARYPQNPKNPTRRALGTYGQITLDEAREKGREWLGLIRRGIDPAIEEERRRASVRLHEANTFEVVANAFLDRYAAKLAKAGEARAIVNKEFMPRWRKRLITEVTPKEAAEAIRAISDRGAPYQAYNAFGWLRRLYNWAISSGEHGVETSPVSKLSAGDIIGQRREPRSRILSDLELRAFWKASEALEYPFGPILQLLLITGQREREVADATWDEFDFENRLWTIPKARMKSARAHEVPLSPAALEILGRLPEQKGKYLFSSTGGKTAISGFSKAKTRMDGLLAVQMSVSDEDRGKNQGIAAWVIHDIRRTVRTHLSALPVQDNIRELVIAHAKQGLHRVYDQHSYQDEKRECLELWEVRLKKILTPSSATITQISDRLPGRVAQNG